MSQDENSKAAQTSILIIDDEDELRDLLSIKFKKIGFEVSVAANGTDAAQLIETHNYSAILCDLNLPDSPKGIELYQLAQARENDSTFIAITGYTQDSPEVSQARQSGIKYVFSKPLRLSTIIDLILNSR